MSGELLGREESLSSTSLKLRDFMLVSIKEK